LAWKPLCNYCRSEPGGMSWCSCGCIVSEKVWKDGNVSSLLILVMRARHHRVLRVPHFHRPDTAARSGHISDCLQYHLHMECSSEDPMDDFDMTLSVPTGSSTTLTARTAKRVISQNGTRCVGFVPMPWLWRQKWEVPWPKSADVSL